MAEESAVSDVRELFLKIAKHPNKRIGEAIAQSAQTSVNSHRFFSVVASAKRSCDQLVRDIKTSELKEESSKVYIKAVNTLAAFLTVTALHEKTGAAVAEQRQSIDYLIMLDDVLAPLSNATVPSATYEELLRQADSMLRSVYESEIDERLKSFLCLQIEHFLWSLRSYRLIGMDGLSRSWGAMMAEVARSQNFKGAGAPAARAWYSRSLPLLGAMGLALTAASGSVEKIDKLLTSGGHLLTLADDNKGPAKNVGTRQQ